MKTNFTSSDRISRKDLTFPIELFQNTKIIFKLAMSCAGDMTL